LDAIQASMEALNFAVQSCHEDLRADESLVDELMGHRLEALFKNRKSPKSGALLKHYLEGLSNGDFDFALQGLLGELKPLSAAAVARLCARWREAHSAWKRQPIEREVAYLWADGFCLKAGADTDGLLLIVAAFVDGTSSVVAAESGKRESQESWLSLLQQLVDRRMNAPRLVVADEALGLWGAIDQIGWDCARQFCWDHRSAQVLAALPRDRRSQAGKLLGAIADANSRTAAKQLRGKFVKRCGVRCAAAGEVLVANWQYMTSFYAFPREHWMHLRTTKLLEAPVNSLRIKAAEPTACQPTVNVEAVLWKLLSAASGSFPELDALQLVRSLSTAKSAKSKSRAHRSRERIG
jgi:transposase-like protein